MHGELTARRIELSRCRSCKAPIIWAVTEREQRIPVDAEPRPDGNLALRWLAVDGPPIAHVLSEAELAQPDDAARFVSHFATCPNADLHRKRSAAA